MATRPKFARMANYSCECAFRESGESEQNGLANLDECIESDQNRLANVGECIESGQFSKMTILASTQIRQKWRIFGEYSNSTNSPASGHCLIKTFFANDVENGMDERVSSAQIISAKIGGYNCKLGFGLRGALGMLGEDRMD
jgi:hypothetical protein